MTLDKPAGRIAVLGCGAVTAQYYLPALQQLQTRGHLQSITLFDVAPERAAAIAKKLGGETASSLSNLFQKEIDLAIVASPPSLHVDHVVQALECGANVLCEKPLALDINGVQEIAAAAARTGRSVYAAHVRRQFPAIKAMSKLLQSKAIGDPVSVRCFEGGPFRWPVSGAAYFTRAHSGGGVLADIGPHCLDILAAWFGVPEISSYQDDAMGGVEANCDLRLAFDGFSAAVRLSRDWYRPNVYRVEGSRGWLEWEVNDATGFKLGFHDTDTMVTCLASWAPGEASVTDDFQQAFLQQVLFALSGVSAELVTIEQAMTSVALIDGCYRVRAPMTAAWMPEQ
jgi:predicted dehydrogenase